MPRKFQVNRKFWVAFGLLAITLRIFTGAPEAQVSFSSLLVGQKTNQAQDLGQQSAHEQIDVFISSDAQTIPEKHRQAATYKKYISPDNFISVLVHEAFKLEVSDAPRTLINVFNELESIYRPASHSPPAVVSAHLPTHTTTTVNSGVLESNFGEIAINNSAGRFGSLKL